VQANLDEIPSTDRNRPLLTNGDYTLIWIVRGALPTELPPSRCTLEESPDVAVQTSPLGINMLSAAQSGALRHVEATAEVGEARTLLIIAGVFERAGYGIEIYHEAIESIRQHARIALHFHPDRLGSQGR